MSIYKSKLQTLREVLKGKLEERVAEFKTGTEIGKRELKRGLKAGVRIGKEELKRRLKEAKEKRKWEKGIFEQAYKKERVERIKKEAREKARESMRSPFDFERIAGIEYSLFGRPKKKKQRRAGHVSIADIWK